jgi:chromosome segregation ATPase
MNQQPLEYEPTLQRLRNAIDQSRGIGTYYRELPDTLRNINQRLERITNDVNKLLRDLQNSRSELGQLTERRNELQGANERAQDSLNAANAKYEYLERERDVNIRELEALRGTSMQTINELNSQIGDLRERHDQLGRDMEAARIAHDQNREEQLARQDTANTERLEELRRRLTQEQDDLRGHIGELTNQQGTLERQIQDAESQVTRAREETMNTGERVNLLTQQIEVLRAQIQEATTEMNNAAEILADLRTDDKTSLENSIRTLTGHIRNIHNLLNPNPDDQLPENYLNQGQGRGPQSQDTGFNFGLSSLFGGPSKNASENSTTKLSNYIDEKSNSDFGKSNFGKSFLNVFSRPEPTKETIKDRSQARKTYQDIVGDSDEELDKDSTSFGGKLSRKLRKGRKGRKTRKGRKKSHRR